MKLITKDDIMQASANLLGKTSLPNGELADWERFAQASLDYCWRYHTWLWVLRKGALVNDSGVVLVPEDMDYYGYRQIEGVTEQSILDTGTNPYLQFNESRGRYQVVGGAAGTAITYSVEPPELTDDVQIPFPSALTIAIGMTVFAKQGENPNKADISQEWDSFHVELDKHTGNQERTAPARQGRSVNRQTRASSLGEFPGKVN